MERVEVYTGFWWGNLIERDHVEGPGIDGMIILRALLFRSVTPSNTLSVGLLETRDQPFAKAST